MRQVYRSKILASGELRQSKVQKVISNEWIGERLRNSYVTLVGGKGFAALYKI